MSTFQVTCPSCGKQYKLPSQSFGRQVRCKCGHKWQLPPAPPSPPADDSSATAATAESQPTPAEQNESQEAVKPQPVKPQPVKAQPVKAQPVKAQPVEAQVEEPQPVKAQPVKQDQNVNEDDAAGARNAARAADENSGKKANEEAKKLIGRELGNFRIDSLLGVGGFGAVYRAFDRSLHRDVALKVLPLALARAGRDKVQRFLQEARSAAKLSHPNVVTVHQICQIEEVYFIVMELVEGQSLADILRTRRLPATEATRIITEAARGLAHAHRRGLIHRDIKPGNIMVTGDGLVKMTDFGLARDIFRDAGEDEIGRAVGTPLYMSPEQCEGDEGDSRSDVYSLAATYYVALTRRPPYEGSDSRQIMQRHCNEPPPDPRKIISELPAAVFRVIEKGMAKEPTERYQTADEMLKALEGLDFATLDPNACLSLEAISAQISGVTPQVGSHVGQALKGVARRVDKSSSRESCSQSRSLLAGPLKWYVLGGVALALVSVAAIVFAVIISLQTGKGHEDPPPYKPQQTSGEGGQEGPAVQKSSSPGGSSTDIQQTPGTPGTPETPEQQIVETPPVPPVTNDGARPAKFDPAREAFEEAYRYAEKIRDDDPSKAIGFYRDSVIRLYPGTTWAAKAEAEVEKLRSGEPQADDGNGNGAGTDAPVDESGLKLSDEPIDAMADPEE